MNEIKWEQKAFKQLEKIKQAAVRQHIYQEVQTLVNFPECQNIKRLVNHTYQYRLRIGNHRVFFNFNGAIHIISIKEVKKRDDNTY